jgi:hypothetical protein
LGCPGGDRHHLTESKLRGGADQFDDFLLANSGDGDDDVVTGFDDLGVGDAAAVHPITDDVHGQVEALVCGSAAVRRDWLQRHRGAAGEVEAI